jgi:hypothetical protein
VEAAEDAVVHVTASVGVARLAFRIHRTADDAVEDAD